MLAGARIGDSGVLVLAGEAGIGKTGLLDDARSRLEGLDVLQARGVESEQAVPFGALLQLVRPVLPLLRSIPAPQAEVLETALMIRDPAKSGNGADRFAVGASILSLVSRASEECPIAIFVDDAHLLDRPSLDAVVFMARRLFADAVAVLMSVRDDHPEAARFADLPQLQLSGLDRSAAGMLVGARLGATPSPDRLARLHRATAGNPLALIELAATGTAALDRLPDDAPLSVPTVLVRRFSDRIDGLSPAGRDTLLVAAADGRSVLTVAEACARLAISPGGLVECEEAGLITLHRDQLEFRHPLVRAAVYATASRDRLRRVHRTLAELLTDDDVDRLAWHLSEGALAPDPRTAETLERLGRQASARGAYAVASGAHERAAQLGADPAPALCAAGEAAWLAGDAERALSLLAAALGRTGADQQPLRTRIRGLRGIVQGRCRSLEDARDTLLAAAEEAVPSDPATAVTLLADTVVCCFNLADMITAERAADRIEALLSDSTISARARIIGGMAAGITHILRGPGERGAEQVRSAVHQLSTTTELRHDHLRLSWLVLGPLFLRESDTGRTLISEAVQDVRSRGAIGSLPFLLFHVARDDAATDHWRRAEDTYLESIRLADETGQTTDLAMSLAGLAWLHARQGRPEDCRRAADRAELLCRQSHIHIGTAWIEFARGDLALGSGDPVDAIAHYRRLLDLLREHQVKDADLFPSAELAEALLHTGRASEAREVAEHYMIIAEEKAQPWALARAHRAAALTSSSPDLAARRFTTALELHRATPDLFELARTHLAFGSHLRRERHRVSSRPHLEAAVDVRPSRSRRLGRSGGPRAAGERTGPAAPRHHGGRGADPAGAPDRPPAGHGTHHARSRGRSVPESEDGRVSPAQGLSQAGHQLAGGAQGGLPRVGSEAR